jgi:4'-phosphopantetheinyl transferase
VPARLSDGEIAVWRVEVARADDLDRLLELLPEDERARAGRLRSAAARQRYVTGRAAARTVLGRALGMPPAELRLTRRCGRCGRTGHGKPSLARAGEIDFSLAHSGRMALVAVGRGRRVGVDVERVRQRMDVLAIARYALSPAEARAVAALPPCRRRAAFFRCWTRKEAYLKARAEGLPGRLRSWSVPLVPLGAVAPDVPGEPDEALRWTIRSLPLSGGYAGAVAGEGDWDLRCRELELTR